MNKGRFLFAFAILLAICYGAIIIDIESLARAWFSVALFLVGVYSYVYSIMYSLDSAYYYGVILVLFGITTYLRHFQEISFAMFYPVYFFVVALTHLAVFVRFRQNIHFKLFAIMAVQGILLMSFKFKIISLALSLILSGVLWLLVLANTIFRLKRNLRRE